MDLPLLQFANTLLEASGGDVVGFSSISNRLLVPQYAPLQTHSKIASHDVSDDEEIQLDKLFGNITPGGGSSYRQRDGKGRDSARKIARKYIRK